MKNRTLRLAGLIVAVGLGIILGAQKLCARPARPGAPQAPGAAATRPATQPATRPATQPSRLTGEAAERAKFVGVWKGACGPIQLELTITERTIHGVQITNNGNVDQGVGEFTLNLNANPHHLDAVQTNARGRRTTYSGIYTLEGDTLRWCLARGDTRPTAFDENTRGWYVVVVKKQK